MIPDTKLGTRRNNNLCDRKEQYPRSTQDEASASSYQMDNAPAYSRTFEMFAEDFYFAKVTEFRLKSPPMIDAEDIAQTS